MSQTFQNALLYGRNLSVFRLADLLSKHEPVKDLEVKRPQQEVLALVPAVSLQRVQLRIGQQKQHIQVVGGFHSVAHLLQEERVFNVPPLRNLVEQASLSYQQENLL